MVMNQSRYGTQSSHLWRHQALYRVYLGRDTMSSYRYGIAIIRALPELEGCTNSKSKDLHTYEISISVVSEDTALFGVSFSLVGSFQSIVTHK